MYRRLFPIALAFICLTLASCGKKATFDEQRDFERDIWNRFTPEVFEVRIDKPEDYYNINLTVAFDTAVFRYGSLPLTINLYTTNNERRMFYSEVAFKENGRWKGEMHDGYRVVTQRIRSYFSFNGKGEHRMEIGQATSQYDLEGIHAIGLQIEQAPLDYDF